MATNTKRVLTVLVAVIIIALIFPFVCMNAQAQTATTFTPSDRFSIPALNGTISFVVNGSCSSATLVNDSWVFSNLRLNNSQPLGNLTVSATNSNMTILLYRSFNLFGRSAQLRYNAQGVGTQTVNFGLNLTQPTHSSEWSINVPGRSGFFAEGTSWKLLHDDSVVISGLTGNVSVTHSGSVVPNDSNLPFYQQHSIIIITVTLLAVIVAVAVIIRFKVRR
jgi:uncharacterized integral membrane protein